MTRTTRTVSFATVATLLTTTPAMANGGMLDAFAPHELGPRASALWNTVRDRNDGLPETAALARHDVAPAVVLSTFANLIDATTGPEGLWRATVAGEWLGCSDNPSSETCESLERILASQTDAEQLAAALRDVAPEHAATVLWAHLDRMEAYLTKYVPASHHPNAIRATPFFQTDIRPVMH